ncbi:LolA family protein [Isoptericola aurantiacus]|uniref:LolA family protein n=1 Tax=Isoptericola aurantiacus TaxID=3377839 RepID=UPI00383ADB72
MDTPRRLSPRARWTVPAVVAGVVAAAFAVPAAVGAVAGDDLPAVTADELVDRVANAEPVPVSGTVVYTARLGLPDVTVSELQGVGPLDLLGGSTTMRVWSDGAESSRAALLGDVSEYSVVRSGAEAWTYSSADDEAVHYVVAPEDQERYDELADQAAGPDVGGDVPTPSEVADLALAQARIVTDVTTTDPVEVAGRTAYQVELTPQTDGTLVDRIRVAVDAETFVPLRSQVWSVQDTETPALEVGFTDVSFDAPDESVFDFSAPAGAEVREVEVPLPEPGTTGPPSSSAFGEDAGVAVSGTGWETVVELTDVDVEAILGATAEGRLPEGSTGSSGADDLLREFTDSEDGELPGMPELDTQALYEQLTTPVDGGRLLTSALLSVLVTDDGRVLAGSVPPESLEELAG